MSKNRNQNILLVEIMIAVLFFALCSTVILETFAAARQYEKQSRIDTAALTEMQNMTELLYAAENPDEFLPECGYEQTEAGWSRDFGDYRLDVMVGEEETSVGVLRTTKIRALRGDKQIAEMPGARYLPGGGAE